MVENARNFFVFWSYKFIFHLEEKKNEKMLVSDALARYAVFVGFV